MFIQGDPPKTASIGYRKSTNKENLIVWGSFIYSLQDPILLFETQHPVYY